MEKIYNVVKMSPDDLDTLYEEIYCKNNLIMEDWFDEPFLNADTHYDKSDFFEIVEAKDMYTLVAVESIYLTEPNTPGFYIGNERKGFVCFELRPDKTIHIVFLEAVNDNVEVYITLLNYLVEKSNAKGFKKIILEILDGRWKIMESILKSEFKLIKTVHCKNKDDIYLFEKALTPI